MEFDKETPDASPDISDADRLAASSRSITIQPLNDHVEVDAMSDEYIANQHILAGPIANIVSDREATVSTGLAQQASASVAPTHKSVGVIVVVGSLIVCLLLGILVAVIVIYR